MGYLKILDSRGNKIRMATPDFEGAGNGRRLSSWGTSSAGPNNTLYSSLDTLRSRSRELVRNDPQIDGALDTLVSNLVGMGISPRWQIPDTDLKKQIQELWADWILEADADETVDFYGLQSLVTRSIIEGGEVFVRFRPRRMEDGLSVPLQLQVLEGDHLDHSYNTADIKFVYFNTDSKDIEICPMNSKDLGVEREEIMAAMDAQIAGKKNEMDGLIARKQYFLTEFGKYLNIKTEATV